MVQRTFLNLQDMAMSFLSLARAERGKAAVALGKREKLTAEAKAETWEEAAKIVNNSTIQQTTSGTTPLPQYDNTLEVKSVGSRGEPSSYRNRRNQT